MTNHELINRIAAERPAPPMGFEERQDALLRGITKKEGEKMKLKISAALAAAIVLMALLTAAAAAEISGIDLFSFLKDNGHQDVLEQAQEAVLRFEALSHSFPDKAEVTVTEALYDGQFVMVYVRVKPLRENLLIIPTGYEETDIRVFYPDAESETIADYALRYQMELVTVRPGIAYIHAGSASPIPIEKQKDGVEASLHADGTLDFLVLGSLYTPLEQELAEMLQNGLLPIQFSIQLNSHEQADDESGPIWETDISMPYRPFQWWSSAAPRIAISQCGVLLDGIAFHGFLLSSKLDIHYIVYDQEVFRQLNDSLRFEALDDQGQPMDSSFHTGYEKVSHDLRKTSY